MTRSSRGIEPPSDPELFTWQRARFSEYRNSGLGAGNGADAAKPTDAEALQFTDQKYLAGTDGWNPVR